MKYATFLNRAPTEDYPHTYVLGAQAPKSRRRINYTTWFACITLAIYLISLIIFH